MRIVFHHCLPLPSLQRRQALCRQSFVKTLTQIERVGLPSHHRQLPKQTCGEGDVLVGVHTLLSGVVQVCHELLVDEEEEKEEEQGRQEEREVERGGQGEENTRTWMTMWMV